MRSTARHACAQFVRHVPSILLVPLLALLAIVPVARAGAAFTSSACPSGWSCGDIGSPSVSGTQSLSVNTYTVLGAGVDIWNTSDQFHYVWRPLGGDGSISTRVASQTNTNEWAKAGVMLRQSTNPGSPNYSAFVTPSHGIDVQYRARQGATSVYLVGVASTVPTYLKVARAGATFTTYTSPDGVAWTAVAGSSVVLSLSSALLEGLAVTSHYSGGTSTATFDSVSLTAPVPPTPGTATTVPSATPTATTVPSATPTATPIPSATATASPVTPSPTATALATSGTSYYVDCVSGADTNAGTSTGAAWKSLSKANSASLVPGDALLLKRSCTWTGTLYANWIGTADKPILIGAYGTGDLPTVVGSYDSIRLNGTYIVVDGLRAENTAPPLTEVGVAICNNGNGWPTGWRAGFGLYGGHDTIQNSTAMSNTVGIHVASASNMVVDNTVTNNSYLSVNTVGGSDDSGAWGILLDGANNTVSRNTLSDNNAWCSYDFGQEGAAIELGSSATNNTIDHNTSINNTTFTELTDTSTNNTFAYNLVVEDRDPQVDTFTMRGTGNRILNNSVYATGASSHGLSQPADSTAVVENNIFWVDGNTAWIGGALGAESNNIFWKTGGGPLVNFSGQAMGSGDQIINPQYANVGSEDFHLQSSSPAIDAGSSYAVNAGYTTDLDGNAVPSGAAPDIGAYEYNASSAALST